MEEGGEALVPATGRRKVLLMQRRNRYGAMRGEKEDAQVLLRGAHHGRGHDVRCREGMVCLHADFRDEPEAGDDAEEAH